MPLKMSAEGRVQCNYCDADRGVKTYTCPFRFCEQVAMCSDCGGAHPEHRTKVGHRTKGCEAGAAAANARQIERRVLSNAGRYLLAASAHVGYGLYHAVFRAGDSKAGRFITASVYERCGREENPTLDDCQRWAGGELAEAPEEFDAEDVPVMLAAALNILSAVPAQRAAASPRQFSPQSTLF